MASNKAPRGFPPVPYGYPELPLSVKDFCGHKVDLSALRWQTFGNLDRRGYVVYNLSYLYYPRDRANIGSDGRFCRRKSMLSPSLIHVIVLFIIERIRTHAPRGSRAVLNAFVHFEIYIATVHRWNEKTVRPIEASDLTASLVSIYSRWIAKNCPSNDKYISFLRSLYKFGVDSGFTGFNRKVGTALYAIRTVQPITGAIARFRDPVKGAFSWEERQQVRTAFANKSGEPRDRALALLFHETGIRLEAAIRLRKRHLRPSPSADEWFLDVPRVKQRKATVALKEVIVSSELALLLLSLLPKNSTPETFLLHWLPDSRVAGTVSESLSRWAANSSLTTLRLGEGAKPYALPVSVYRFRRSLATEMAEDGASPEMIAAMLDDKSLAMAVVYTTNSSTVVDVLEKTLDTHPAWFRLLQLFQGKVDAHGSDREPSILGGVPYLIEYPRFAERIGIIGKCAKKSACKLLPPLSCYSCEFFRPDLHEERHVLQVEQIKLEIDERLGLESDRVIGVFRSDLIAILTVIAEIREYNGQTTARNSRRAIRARAIAAEMPTT